MDWKYKHFRQERFFAAPPDSVLAAARAVMAESLGWKTTDMTNGFTAAGSSFGHDATANFQIQPIADGTKVAVDLLVERAGVTGFMLFDVGGYYNIQIRKWLNAIQSAVQGTAAETASASQRPPVAPALTPPNKTAARVFHGCLLFIAVSFGIYLLVTLVSAVVGLVTGNLLLIGRGHNATMHGPLARTMSAVILLFGVWIIWRISRNRRGRSAMP